MEKYSVLLDTILPRENKTTPAVQYFLNTQFAVNTHKHVSKGNLLLRAKQSHTLDQCEIFSRRLLS